MNLLELMRDDDLIDFGSDSIEVLSNHAQWIGALKMLQVWSAYSGVNLATLITHIDAYDVLEVLKLKLKES